MIPYFPQPRLHLFGPVYLYGFGTMVAVALFVGWRITTARCRKEGLDPDRMQDMFGWVVVTGFIVAHLYSVLAYYPQDVMRNPLMLLKMWENISSFGGIAGGILGFWLYFRFKGNGISFKEQIRYLDVAAYAFPFGWLFGRLGCTLAHDHPGAITSFPLAISLESEAARRYIRLIYEEAGRRAELLSGAELSRLGVHDLGWDGFLFTAVFLVPV
ncbi:MAG: prolipoprotein diacylglyceryl transferase, partial [Syntrophorhabdaceae bacterium]|nr:prolipoprotein diacylglyceryl transferase [Syntrophorhabdaceae bacterium]